MSLRLIYGKTGTGKSTMVFNEIKNNINNGINKFIITPEQFSFSAEKNLLNLLEVKSLINAEVITFNRMAERVSEEVGGKTELQLTKSGKAMLIYSILESQKKNLHFLKNNENNIELVMQAIKEFKKHGVSEEALKNIINKTDNQLLITKLEDINMIYNKYQTIIANSFIDEEDKLTKLSNRLVDSTMFENTEIYIDEFSGFTKQEYNIIKELLKKAKRITVVLCMDSKFQGNIETDIFYHNKETWFKLKKIAEENNIEIEEVFLEKTYKFKAKDLGFLENNIYSIPYKSYNETPENIKVALLANPYKQMEYIANEITKLVRDKRYKYKDIAIITKDIEENSNLVKAILKQTNNIPVFIDNKEDLGRSIFIKYILSILEVFSSNWSCEAVMSYIKSGLISIEKKEIFELENYAIKWGIRGSKWYKEDWNYEEENPNALRKKIIEPLLNLKNSLEMGKNAKTISTAIYQFLEQHDIYNILEQKIKTYENKGELIIAQNLKQSIDILLDVMEEMCKLYGDSKISFKEYKDLLKIGLSYKELGNIPEVIDQVIIGDVNRTRSSKIKVAFVIGVNDGKFPEVNKSEGFFNDNEREIFKTLGAEIAKGTLDVLYEEQFNIYKALTIPEEKLYILYTSADKEQKALRPSVIISKIKKIFPKLVEESNFVDQYSGRHPSMPIRNENLEISTKQATFKELLANLQKLQNGKEIDSIWYEIYNYYKNDKDWVLKLEAAEKGLQYTNEAEQITEKNIKKLYGEKLKTSVSKLETYKKCPFSFLLKYGLKLKEKEEYKIKSIDTGSFMHDVIDTFFKKITNVYSLELEDIEAIVQEIIEEKLSFKKNYRFSSSKKFIVLTNRLEKLIIKSIEYIVYQIKNSDFEVLANELEFTKEIDNIEITGKIDRLDISKDGTYLRIIDYKSSSKNINLNEVFEGIQIQLLTYMDVISEKQNKLPAGVLYFNLIEPVINNSNNLNNEEIKEKIKNEFRMKGLIVADINVVRMMDKSLEKGASSIIPAYIDKDGNISSSRSSAVSKEDFKKLQLKVRNLIKQISNEILSGNIDIKPILDKKTKISSCKYCEYKAICMFNSKVNCYNYLENKSKEELLRSIK